MGPEEPELEVYVRRVSVPDRELDRSLTCVEVSPKKECPLTQTALLK
jgi:hypothetical protein